MVRLTKAEKIKIEKQKRLLRRAVIGGVSIGVLSVTALFVFVFQDVIYREVMHWFTKSPTTGVCLPDNASAYGIDVSSHQGRIDWSEVAIGVNLHNQTTVEETSIVKTVPVDFAFVKATEGGTHIDKRFDYNFRRAYEVGIQRGAYHYYKPRTSAHKQAAHFINTVHLLEDDLPPVVDIEEMAKGVSEQALCDSLVVMLQLLEMHYAQKPILYTYQSFWNTIISKDSRLIEYPLWIAQYDVVQPEINALYQFWQFSCESCILGINGAVDLNLRL